MANNADDLFGRRLTRRQLLAALGWAGAAAAASGPAAAWARGGRGVGLARLAASTKPAGSDLGAVKHIVS